MGIEAEMYDPWVNEDEFTKIYNAKCMNTLNYQKRYDVLILATPHEKFIENWKQIKKSLKDKSSIFDLKSALPKEESDFRL